MADVIIGAVGATVGFMVGGPAGAAIGWAIGSTAGSMYAASRQTIRGPSIGDAAQQIATEGAPIPIVFGRSPPIMGTVVADAEPTIKKTKKRTGGKGSPKVETEEFFRTYAIMICEGPATLLQAWRDGRLVYDAEASSSDSDMAEDNAAFMEYARWIPGTHAQVPHPVLEEIYGVGDAPAFRGRCVILFEQEDVTDKRGARSQWHFRVFRGSGITYQTTPPYHMTLTEGIGIQAFGRSGGSREIVRPYDYVDGLDPTAEITDGELRISSLEYGYIEEVGLLPTINNGTLKNVQKEYNYREEIDLAPTIRDGLLKQMPHYTDVDELDIVVTVQDGQLE